MRLRPSALLATLALAGPVAVLGLPGTAAGATVPTLVLTSPTDNAVVWDGDLVLAAEATPAEGGAPIARVDFYIDSYDPHRLPAPFRSDDTYPYKVSVPVADLGWQIAQAHKITAVAMDTAGRSSSHPSSAGASGSSFALLGPPPVVAWSPAPPPPDTVAGSTSGGLLARYSATVDDRVPASTHPSPSSHPQIYRVEHLLDGKVVHDYQPADDPRTWTGSGWFSKEGSGLTGGVRQVGFRVTAAYSGTFLTTSEITADVLIGDGTTLTGPVTAGTRTVNNGFVVTAGDVVRFDAPIAAKVPGTHLQRAYMYVDDAGHQGWTLAYHDYPCEQPDTCLASTTVRSNHNAWYVPDEPGRATLTLKSATYGDHTATVVRRDIVIQAAAKLTASVSRSRIRLGEAIGVRGRLTRLDNAAPQPGRTVRVQWRRARTSTWTTLTTRTTDAYGRISARVKPQRSGDYRLVSPAVSGKLGAGLSAPVWVAVRR